VPLTERALSEHVIDEAAGAEQVAVLHAQSEPVSGDAVLVQALPEGGGRGEGPVGAELLSHVVPLA
jgi:hypothetical protein